MSQTIRIYVADLAAYNAGHLHGVWIDATLPVEVIQAQILAMLATSPVDGAEEYAIHDHEGFGSYRLGEYAGIDTAHAVARFIEEFPAFGAALLDHCSDIDEARRVAEDNYCGCYESLATYAQDLTEETTDIPSHLAHYIDYDSMARDMEVNGDVLTIETGLEVVHIFWER